MIAVIDIGKTHSKVLVVSPESGEVVWRVERANRPVQGSVVRELDVREQERWILESLRSAATRLDIRQIVPITHGAAAVLIDKNGYVLAAPDYEDPVFDSVEAAYRPLRDDYRRTLSPSLPLGLNLGRQLFLLEAHAREVLADTQQILLYPQYWSWRLSGVAASEMTSLGCHTDLWCPGERAFSALACTRDWVARFPEIRGAHEVLGTLRADLAEETGLSRSTQVLCGIHDSNASYLCHLRGQEAGKPFAVISSGTWTVVMAHEADLTRLHESRDMLANVDAYGTPVATARFMGGREYAAIAGGTASAPLHPDIGDLQRVIEMQAFAVPGFANAGGPFAHAAGRIVASTDLRSAERAALATLYCALMTELLLEWLGATGDTILDGPFAENELYYAILSALCPNRRVFRAARRAGPAEAGLLLAGQSINPCARRCAEPANVSGLDAYRAAWRELLPNLPAA